MIGFTYCGLYGEGVAQEGTLLSTVDCAKCKTTTVSSSRFKDPFALKLIGKRNVHAGCLRDTNEQLGQLDNIEFHVAGFFINPVNIDAALKALEGERKIVAKQLAVDEEKAAKLAAKEIEEQAAEAAKRAAQAAAEAAKQAAETAAEAARVAAAATEDSESYEGGHP